MQEKKCKAIKLTKSSQAYIEYMDLPPIPNKRYFTIGEASELCGLKPHVLRFWEQEFIQLKPSKRRGNRRYYECKDLIIVRQIRKLLYTDGFTIEGARSKLAEKEKEPSNVWPQPKSILQKVIADLEIVLQNLNSSLVRVNVYSEPPSEDLTLNKYP
jgi:DNA-binding transcriptional MerR regulator